MRPVVLPPGRDAAELAAALAAAGYRPVGGAESGLFCGPAGGWHVLPDIATGGTTLVPAGNPKLPAALRPVTPRQARALMTSSDAAERLLGLRAASALRRPGLAPAVAGCLFDTHPAVAECAAATVADLLANSPFPPVGATALHPRYRAASLQAMRRGPERAPDALVLRCLDSPDWELAATALLAAARRGIAPDPARLVSARLPRGPADGVTAAEAAWLQSLRDGLAAGTLPAADTLDPTAPPALAPFIASLTEPLPEDAPPRPAAAICQTAEGPVLEDGTPLIWVPPMTYWLGDAALHGTLASPPRRVEARSGLYIDAHPRGAAPLDCARAEAAALARGLGRPVRLLAADAWERAARGTDGRRYLDGAAPNPATTPRTSPLGLVVRGPEWTDPANETGPVLACALGREGPAAARRRGQSTQPHWYRFAYLV